MSAAETLRRIAENIYVLAGASGADYDDLRVIADRLEAIEAAIPEIDDLLDTLDSKYETEWWNCSGGPRTHDAIRNEQAEARAVANRFRDLFRET